MLDNLTTRLAKIVKTIRGEARLTEANVQDALREVRIALLEADVALPVVKHFIEQVRVAALGQEVVGSLTPGQALVGIVHRELTKLMGEAHAALNLAVAPPAVILMAGLQGSGKTTTVGKLSVYLREQKKKVLVVSCDIYRPAAIEQLKTVAAQAGAEFFASHSGEKPEEIAKKAVDHARTHYCDVVIVDTAGRLAVDEPMMQEIAALHAALKPAETLFVVDAMQGQDAVNVAHAFNERLPLTGVVLTKLDGDSRGGAALSVRHVTGKPIKFAGTGEKLADKLRKGKGFDLEDFKQQLQQMNKMGGIASMMDKLPAQLAGQINPAQLQDSRQFVRIEGIINSMTKKERANPEIIKATRKRRIAAGAGVPVQEVNRMLKQFEQMQQMMKMMKGGNLQRMMRNMKGMLPGMR